MQIKSKTYYVVQQDTDHFYVVNLPDNPTERELNIFFKSAVNYYMGRIEGERIVQMMYNGREITYCNYCIWNRDYTDCFFYLGTTDIAWEIK